MLAGLLLGRHRYPARHHPPGCPATLGQPVTHTAATAALTPEPSGSGAGAFADDTTETIAWGDFRTWERQLAIVGHLLSPHPAARPHRGHRPHHRRTRPGLRHRGEPGGCCTWRAATAASPSARPARRSTSATPGSSSAPGSLAAKASPRPIAAHPCVFATFTAPSFGPVHSRRMRGKTVLPCRPRRDANARRCPHGRDISCPTRHVEDDPRLGRPMCGDCYDYDAAVLFNAYAGDLWRRFTTYLPRQLARLAGVTGKELRAALRIRYVKVAEYQARGVVHFHAVIRLDATGEDYQPPPARYYRRAAVRRHRPGRRRRFAHRWPGQRTCPARLRTPNRRPAHPARHDLPGTGQAARSGRGGELHRQVRHQDPDRARPPGHPHPHRPRHPGAALLQPTTGP